MQSRMRTKTRWLLLICGTMVIIVAVWNRSFFKLASSKRIFAYATFGGSLNPFFTSDSESVGNLTYHIDVTEKVHDFYEAVDAKYRGLCNAPFLKPLKKPRYTNISHEHIASIVLMSSGYHGPTREDRKNVPIWKVWEKHLNCDYGAAARELFADSLYTDFVSELRELVVHEKTWQRELELVVQSKARLSFAEKCNDGQLTAFGVGQHLLVGRKLAQALNGHESKSIRSFLENTLRKSSSSAAWRISIHRSKANILGTLATLFALASDLNLRVPLRELVTKVKLEYTEHEYFCKAAEQNYVVQSWNASALTCDCKAVKEVERECNAGLDASIAAFLVTNAGATLRAGFNTILDRLEVAQSKPHRFADVAHAMLVPMCSFVESLHCESSSNPNPNPNSNRTAESGSAATRQKQKPECFMDKELESTATAFVSLGKLLDPKCFIRLASLRAVPLAAKLISKVKDIEDASKSGKDFAPLEVFVTSSHALTNLLKALHLMVVQQGQSLFSVPFGSVVTFELFQTTRRRPGTVVLRLVVNGENALRHSNFLCDRTYNYMCEAESFVRNAKKMIPLADLGTTDYNYACSALAWNVA